VGRITGASVGVGVSVGATLVSDGASEASAVWKHPEEAD